MIGAAVFVVFALAANLPEEPAHADPTASAHDLIFLAENRPVFVRLKVMAHGRPFEASWIDSIRAIWASLDRNGDGTLTTKEADPALVNALVRLAIGATDAPDPGGLDVHPKDGKVTIDELAEALRPILGPFRLQPGRQAVSRTDALFDQLDRDKDEQLTRPELSAIAGSLRPLDLDDDEMVSVIELEPYRSPEFASLTEESTAGRARLSTLPGVIEVVAGESSFRPARLLLKKYDKGKGDVPGRPDGKLSTTEFAIDPNIFSEADKNGDDALDSDELRKLLAEFPIDLGIDVTLASGASGSPKARVETSGELRKGTQLRRVADGAVEFAVGKIRIDIHVEDGNTMAAEAQRFLLRQFKAADANKDGYLERKEQAAINRPGSPLAGLADVIDRDGDGKIYWKELIAFANLQIEAARSRLVLTTDDQGRAIFGIVDLNRDRRLGAREVMRTVERVMSWDGDGDGRIAAEEIPYHFQVTVARAALRGLTGEDTAISSAKSTDASQAPDPAAGPSWFQKMDRNHDGDVSRREFLGPRDQFDRLDRDNDGLIDADEAIAGSK